MAASRHFQDQIQQKLQHQYFEQMAHISISPAQIVQITNGDPQCITSLHNDFCNNRSILSHNPIQSKRYLLVSALTLLTRYAISAGVDKEEIYVSSDLYIQRCDNSATIEKIENLFLEILKYYIRKIQTQLCFQYSSPVLRAIHYITEHLYESISVKTLCKNVGYSQSYLSALFKNETGYSILKYIHKAKIDQACKLLYTTSSSLIEISSLLDYSSLSHFVSIFHKITGITPQTYRRSVNAQQLHIPNTMSV